MNTLHAQNTALARLVPAIAALMVWLSASPAMVLACGLVVTEDIKLESDLLDCPGDGLIVAADGVTIDLDGHSIVGFRNERTAGIRAVGVNDLTITGGTIVTGRGTIAAFERGIYLYDAEDVEIEYVEVNANRYEGLLAYKSTDVLVTDSDFTNNSRSAIWIYDTSAQLTGNLGEDNPNRTFYLSGGDVTMDGNVARGGAYYSAFTFANGYTDSSYTLTNNLAESVSGVGYLFAWGFTGEVVDEGGNRAVNTGSVECWTEEGTSCPLDLTADASWDECGNGVCEAEESVCSCAADCGLPPAEDCGDGIDNDCDGDMDCGDPDCALAEICYIEPVPGDCAFPDAACARHRR